MEQISVRPMPVGAEILGLADGREQDPEVCALLYDAWMQHGILLFHGVDSIDRHLALSRCFGELEVHPFAPARSDLHPLLIELGGKKRGPVYLFDGKDHRVNRIAWHRDTAYTPDICKGAMLRMVEPSAAHGETMFADTAMAYDDLPADVKARLEGLEYKASLRLGFIEQTRPGAHWTSAAPDDPDDPQHERRERADQEQKAIYPSVIHPAVLTHPESGRKCIFLSPTYVDYFIGMGQAESDELLDYLVGHMLQPRYVYVHRWAKDDAMLWDNRRFMHAGLGNAPEDRRFGLRTTLAGPVRTGRYFDANATAGGAPVMAD